MEQLVIPEKLKSYFDPRSTAEIKIIEGTHAASYGAKLARVQVISAYPITPQTSIVEKLSEMCANGELEAQFIKVESEHSAMACVIGAAATGARAFTATSSQGLALMHEVLHWAAAARLPIVLANVNRAMAPPWSIWADQTDSLAQRDTGWLQIYAESNQEVLDMVLQAFKLAETVRLPAMINMDAFFLSHTTEPVAIPRQELVDEFLPPYRPRYKLDVDDPRAFGGLAKPDQYYEFRYHMQLSMERAQREIPHITAQFKEMFGRDTVGLVEAYRTEGARYLLVTAGTITSTTRLVVDAYRERGVPLGLIKIRFFRPFPREELQQLTAGVEKIGVIDRNLSFGSGGIFFNELKGALYNGPHHPLVNGYVAGLGGRDVTPEVVEQIVEHLLAAEKGEDLIWIGVRYDSEDL